MTPRRAWTAELDGLNARALLLTGVYGTGKSSVAAEIAEMLEETEPPFAAIDLDWLCWSNVTGSGHEEHTILALNLASVAGNYRNAGVGRFVLAGSVMDAETLEALRDAIGVPLTVVRLTAPLSVIEARLDISPNSARAEDLERTRDWLATGAGVGLEDIAIENVAPIRETALRVLELVGWLHQRPDNAS